MDSELCFGFSTNNWQELSKRLDSSDQDAWTVRIAVFERRIRERFLRSIDALFAADTKAELLGADSAQEPCIPGFAIVAICCLLIETLQAFREPPPPVADPADPCAFPAGSCIKPPSGTNQQFIKFLRRPGFGKAFEGNLANKFVSGIRNGILHEAETRRWVIWRNEPADKIVAEEDNGYALNRSLFYAAIKQEFECYLQELRDPDSKDLRLRFKMKMDALCRKA